MSSSLPGFEIIERIGKGGMAEVWKARQLSLDRIVAIKVLTNQSLPDEAARARFHEEAKAAARVNHPGIVQVYDAGEKDGIPYYVMEFVEGKTVGDLLEEHKFLPEENALIIAECVAIALGHAWEKARIVHCDIKPDNLLVAHDGTIKIADLGLARIIGSGPNKDDEEMVLGTPNYTSPEQSEGGVELDCRSDIYSLGATLYHMATGTIPFRGSRGSAAMDLHVSAYLADPLDLRPELQPATAWLIEKLMVKDRNLRHQNWNEALADIKAAQKGKMPAPPIPEPGQSTVRRSAARTAESTITRPVKRIVAPPDAQKRRLVIAPDKLGSAARETTRTASVGQSVFSLVFLAALNMAVYGYIFSPLLPAPAPMAPPPVVVPQAEPEPVPSAPPPAAAVIRKPSQEEAREIHELMNAHAAVESAAPEAIPASPEQEVDATPAAEDFAGPDTVVRWDDPEFARAAKLYNDALADYTAFQKTRANRSVLINVEKNCREAIRVFEQCRPRAPKDLDMEPFITDCYHLISDVRHSTQIKKD